MSKARNPKRFSSCCRVFVAELFRRGRHVRGAAAADAAAEGADAGPRPADEGRRRAAALRLRRVLPRQVDVRVGHAGRCARASRAASPARRSTRWSSGQVLRGRHRRDRTRRRVHAPRADRLPEGHEDALAAGHRQPRLLVPADRHRSAAISAASTTSTSTARRSRTTARRVRIKQRCARCRRSTTRSRPPCRWTAVRSGTTATRGGGKTRRRGK